MSNNWTKSNNFTWTHTSPCWPLGDTANTPSFYLLIFYLQAKEGTTGKPTPPTDLDGTLPSLQRCGKSFIYESKVHSSLRSR